MDESSQSHLFTGGSLYYYLTRRLALGPEVIFLYRNSRDRDYGAGVNVAFSLRDPSERVRPYVVGGVGVLYTSLPFGSFTETSWSGGMGVKVGMGRGWFIAPEFRLGLEAIVRATLSVGYTWARD